MTDIWMETSSQLLENKQELPLSTSDSSPKSQTRARMEVSLGGGAPTFRAAGVGPLQEAVGSSVTSHQGSQGLRAVKKTFDVR